MLGHPSFYVHRTRNNTDTENSQENSDNNAEDDEDIQGKWILSGELKAGDWLLLSSGEWRQIQSIERIEQTAVTYNFEVSENHNYFVGQNAVLVHNTSRLPRFDGPKPRYDVNGAHVPGNPGFNPKKTPLPLDAEDVFRRAVPDDPIAPRNWYGTNNNGQIYRFSGDNAGTAHFSGIDGVGDGIRNITRYALQRLAGR